MDDESEPRIVLDRQLVVENHGLTAVLYGETAAGRDHLDTFAFTEDDFETVVACVENC